MKKNYISINYFFNQQNMEIKIKNAFYKKNNLLNEFAKNEIK